MKRHRAGRVAGRPVIAASWAGTALFAASALPAAAGVDATGYVAVTVALALFAASVPLSVYALARGAVRTARDGERVTVTGLFFARGSAPRPVRLLLNGSLAAALAVLVVTASAEPFGTLVPVYPLALTGVWAARHGTFPPIPEPPARRSPTRSPAEGASRDADPGNVTT